MSSDHAEIRGVGEDFFDAVEARDTELAASIVVPEGVFVSTRRG